MHVGQGHVESSVATRRLHTKVTRYQSPLAPFTQPTRLYRKRISVCRYQFAGYQFTHDTTWANEQRVGAHRRHSPAGRPTGATRRVGAAGVLHLHWHLQLWGAVAKRSVRRRREASLESSQRHERPDWQSSSLLHVG
eukprot:scaffold118154_cov63-Phaeocystis_antarctica.AAC.2